MFDFVLDNSVYKDSEKNWFVELSQYTMYWYDLVRQPHKISEDVDTRNCIVEYLKDYKEKVESVLEKRFVYFICTRKRVRFDIEKNPSFGFFDKKLKVYLRVGREKKRVRVKLLCKDAHTERIIKPKVKVVSDRFIDIEGLGVLSVHDFLSVFNLNLGYKTKVQYVGYTKNPDTRPTNGAHTGLSDALGAMSSDENDTFIVFNLFKVISFSEGSMLSFCAANSMTDEVGVDLEGSILEKCFIFYFDSDTQTRNRPSEMGELRKDLINLSQNNKIRSVQIYYETKSQSEYFDFYSSAIEPAHRHVFTASLDGGVPKINPGSEMFSNNIEPFQELMKSIGAV